MKVIGALSGTSMNAKEFGLFEISGKFPKIRIRKIARASYRFPEAQKIKKAMRENNFEKIAKLHFEVGKSFEKSLKVFLRKFGGAELLGFHGQTVFHLEEGRRTTTFQIGEPCYLAKHIPTVWGFRYTDISAGGKGAPLSPIVHFILFSKAKGKKAVLNLGGIANITLIPTERFEDVSGFDVGPANALADHYCQEKLGIPFDKDGKLASRGKPNMNIARKFAKFFLNLRKKSLGVEVERAKEKFLKEVEGLSPEDALSTAYLISAMCITQKLKSFSPEVVIVCGGGAKNPFFVNLIRELSKKKITTTQDFGFDPEDIEPALFALLAYLNITKTKIDMKRITGAKFPYIPGVMCSLV